MTADRQQAHYHKVPLLNRRFRYAQRSSFFGHARLFGDRIELIDWGLRGRRKQVIPLESIVHVDYHPLEDGSNLSLQLDSDSTVEVSVEDAHQWRQFFEEWLSYNVLASAKIMDEPEKAAAIAG